MNTLFKTAALTAFACAVGASCVPVNAHATALKPNLKVLMCTGDYGMYAQDRVPIIEDAVAKASPGANVSWESHQAYAFTKVLESPGYAEQFDTIVMGDIGIGQLTSKAQANLVKFVQDGGGLVYVIWAKSSIPYSGATEAVPMPLAPILPVAYPDFTKTAAGAAMMPSTDAFFQGIDFAPLKSERDSAQLPNLLRESSFGKGHVLALYGAFGADYKSVAYATVGKVPDSWDSFPQLGEIWVRVLNAAAKSSPVRDVSQAAMRTKIKVAPLQAMVSVDATKPIDDIRAADFSIVALKQLYVEDGGKNEALFLALNPLDWYDRLSQEVLPNTAGVKADKPALFKEYNIKGIYMADDSYGNYAKWTDATYTKEIDEAIADKKKWPTELQFLQAGNEPPLDANYVKFSNRFVGGVLQGAPDYKVIGPNKAFNFLGVEPKEMQFYIDNCGSLTDILNWHTYAQPPATVLAEARYWSDKATGHLRTPGQAKVMFTESDAWNTEDSQFDYLMERAFTFLPEPRIIANFQYCMDSRAEGGPYRFGVLQPDNEFSANYNGYWAWRNLRGKMATTAVTAPVGADHLHAISSISKDGNTVTSVIYYDSGYFDGTAGMRADKANVAVSVKLPAGNWTLNQSNIAWNVREDKPAAGTARGTAKVAVELTPYHAVALTWTKAG